ncbi:uncharacterized protein [Triticum aestivum]|uniref:uncharacterized protein n=1 Tax=Triticum aestivum TaxID=4565 RepID=UPI001D015A24|nr:uncharacterized protein LOC123042938 [Triticum aestivum]
MEFMRLFKGLFPDLDGYEDADEGPAEKKCIFFINGLQSAEQWEFIKLFVEGNTESRIILIANEENVSNHFVEHLEANNAVHPLTKASDYYGYGDNKVASRSIFLSNRMEVSRIFVDSQQDVAGTIWRTLDGTGVSSVWGIAGVGKSTLVKVRYQDLKKDSRWSRNLYLERFAWVDVPAGPFDLVEFSRLLLLDFHHCDLEAMEAAAIGIMQGQDPIQGCREILRQDGYLVIIDGLRSTHDWDLIETVFLSQPTKKAKIVVITTEESIAKHCVKPQANEVINVKCLEDADACLIFNKVRLIALKHCSISSNFVLIFF